MNKRSKIIITLIISIVLTAVIIPFTGCNDNSGDNKISEIYVSKADAPRLNYVQGQELDLSDGKLTAVVNGSETKVPLTAPEVTVTGYNRDTIGDQILTIQYSGFSTTITVNVAERAVAEKFESKYFVGDTFNPDKGKIKILTDEAKSFYVNMNDAKVSLVSFDSSKAGTVPVTVLYSDGTNSYYCQFDVTVYDKSTVEFTAPAKTEYLSHDDGLSISGGYFKVTSADSTLTMNVPLSETMVKGFDLSAATIDNRTTPLEQTLTVEYLDKTFTYKIYITFSGVSIINHYANEDFSKIDLEKAKEEGLSDAECQAAMDAINEYYKLSDTHKALLSEEVTSLLGRVGSVAVAKVFLTEASTYSNTFVFKSNTQISFVSSNYEQVAADVERLNDPEAEFNTYAKLLRQVKADFGTLTLVEGVTVNDYIPSFSENLETALKEVLNHFVDVFELVKDIPENWDAESLKPYGDAIRSAAMQIYVAGYYKQGNASYYTKILSPWREKNDLFDILYTYFLYDYEDGADFMRNYMWGSMPMPGLLEQWYTELLNTISYENDYKSYASSIAFLADISPYMYNYFYTLEICEEIKNSGNQFWIDIYNTYNGDYLNRTYMYTYSYGYLYHTKGMIDSNAYHELWEKYYDVLKLYYADTISAETNKAEIVAMFDAFEKLDPSELLGFLSSLNLMYTSAQGSIHMLGYTQSTEEGQGKLVYNVFSYILSNYYSSYLTETNKVLFNDLLSAMEDFVLIGYKENALEEFNAKMQKLSEAIDVLPDDDKANFKEYFGKSYDKYYAIYELTSGKISVELTSQETALCNELHDIIKKYFMVYSAIYTAIQEGKTVSENVYPVLYALYARAYEIKNNIYEIGSEKALLAMYVTEYEIYSVNNYSLEKAFYLIDNITTSVLTSQSAIVSQSGESVSYATYWDLFVTEEISKLLSDMSDVLYSAYFKDGKPVDNAMLLSFMGRMRELSVFNLSIVNLLHIDGTFYKALDNYYTSVLSEDGLAVSQKLVEAEKAYTTYIVNKNNAENRDSFTTAMDNLKADYEKLSDADKSYLSDMYNYYMNLCEQIKNDTEAAA